jgi:Fur family ferric uptake transcriptional regulator
MKPVIRIAHGCEDSFEARRREGRRGSRRRRTVTSIAPVRAPWRAHPAQHPAQALRARGLRASTARRLVLEALHLAGEPVTAEQIASGLDGLLPTGDLASVYRNLEVLEAHGLAAGVHFGQGPGRWAPPGREYLTCTACGGHVAVDPSELDAVRQAIRWATGFHADFTRFPVAGRCPACGPDIPRPSRRAAA